MKKIIMISLIIITIINCVCYASGEPHITINYRHNDIELKESPRKTGDTIMLPILETAGVLNIQTKYYDLDNKILMQKDDIIVNMKLNDRCYTVNSEKKEADVAPYLYGNDIMVSSNVIGECFGYELKWIGIINTLCLYDKKNNIIEEILEKNSISINGTIQYFIEPIYKIDGMIYVPVEEYTDKISEKIKIPTLVDISEDGNTKIDFNTSVKNINLYGSTEQKLEGVVPDEETAYAMGKLLLEKYAGRPLEYTNKNGEFYLKTTYNSEGNYWSIVQEFKRNSNVSPRGGGSGMAMTQININRNTGEVIGLCADVSIYEKLYGNFK